ncbi:hypothetical protein [Nostoc sp.]|uniref:type II toxin-antitoxin system HicA family toxin n=1 Tax=Nostoc sp. TaxID=1180 RepID=UPI002FF735D9
MSKVPNLPYTQILAALERDGWIVVRQRGSRSTLAKILKQARMDLERFLDLL